MSKKLRLELLKVLVVIVWTGSLTFASLYYVPLLFFPKPIPVTTLGQLSNVSDLHFLPFTVLVEGGFVNQQFAFYHNFWCYGIVTMPTKSVPLFMKQAIPTPVSSQYQEGWKEYMTDPPPFKIKSNNWKIGNVKHFEVLPGKAGGYIFVDEDNPITAKVYLWK